MRRWRKMTHVAFLCAVALLASSCKKGRKAGDEAAPATASQSKLALRSPSPNKPAASREEADTDDKADTAVGIKDEKKKGKDGKEKPRTWKRSSLVPNTSKLMIGDTEHLPLQGMQAYVQVDGFRARVALDYYFYNDRARQFEGTFKLRLPTGASPYFFAFGKTAFKAKDGKQPVFFDPKQVRAEKGAGDRADPAQIMQDRQQTWSEPKEARMVPKEKAAHAYTTTVRRRVDPALMEWSGAGVFSARVFPLEAKKLHRVVIAYDLDLTPIKENMELRFHVPKTKVRTVIDVDAAALPKAGVSVSPSAQRHKENGRYYWRFDNPTADAIVVRVTEAHGLLLTGEDAKTGSYFAASFRPRLPEGKPAAGAGRAVFMVDTSLSSNPDRFNVYLKLLRALLEKNRDQLKEFAVLFFNVEAGWWQPRFTPNNKENVDALLKHANNLALEGATDLRAALSRAASPKDLHEPAKSRWDLFLLSDGAATWGESDQHAIAAALRSSRVNALYAYSTGMAGTDRRMLSKLARDTGGAVFSVTGEAELNKAARAHRARPWHLEGVTVAGGSDLMLAGRPLAIYPGQRLQLVGRGKVKLGAKVKLKLRRGGRRTTVSTTLERLVRSQLTPRSYGQIAVEHLEELSRATEEYSVPYACHFRVPGQTSSLLMLESEADYKRFNIKPQEHAFVVKAKPATSILATVLKKIGDTLSDPKATFMAWLERMKGMPGVKFTVSTALKMALQQMPRASFDVQVPALAVKNRTWAGVAPGVRASLASHKLDYAQLVREADRRKLKYGAGDALRALSSLVENSPGDTVLGRDVGFSAVAMGLRQQAYHLFKRVAARRPWEPQTYRAMANVLAAMGKADLALAYYEVGLAGQWNSRFGEFSKILSLDYLRFLRRHPGKKTSVPAYTAARLKTLSDRFASFKGQDLLVVITWNTDNSDVDLHVMEPTGEDCYYQNRQTKIGGHLTTDVTQGYGPEMYTLGKAKSGAYKIRVKYFASVQNRATARTKVQATVYRHWGTKKERRTDKTVTLAEGKQMHSVATVEIP